MQEKINILNELKEVGAGALIEADNRNYFTVPDFYFSTLPDNILLYVFADSLPKTNPYSIPEKYFNNLPEVIVDKLALGSFNSNTKEFLSVPEGYFNTLSDNILKKINPGISQSAQDELNELSPFLSTISKTNVYSVPEDYFDEFNFVGDFKKDNTEAKVIPLRSTKRRWINYAAAACIAAFACTGGYLYFFGNKAVENSPVASLANMDVQKEISVLSDDEIDNYLKDNSSTAVYTNVGDDDQQQNMDIQNLLQNVSDEEIQQYLKQDPESAETGGGI